VSAIWIVWRHHSCKGSVIASVHATEAGAAQAQARQLELRESYHRKLHRFWNSNDAELDLTPDEIDANCDGVSVEKKAVAP
jgi:hypothetical protein